MERISTETKPNGNKNSWLECGQFSAPDGFGDTKWVPAKIRYPKDDSRLKIQRKYSGKGASQYISWIIDVPDDFPEFIVKRSRENEILFTPNVAHKEKNE